MKLDPAVQTSARDGHLPLLEALEGGGNVSQRTLGERLGMAVSRVNRLIRQLQEEGLLEVVDEEVRPFAYRLTDAGRDYLRTLAYERYRRVLKDFRKLQDRIRGRLEEIRDMGVERLVFYGAGDIMDVTFPLAQSSGLIVVAVVDDDPTKQGTWRCGLPVSSPDRLDALDPFAVLITTFRHADAIRTRLKGGLSGQAQVLQI